MYPFLLEAYERLLDLTNLNFKRFLFDSFKPGRLTALIGPRGAGKTTLLLQWIKSYADTKTAFYFAADSVYFQQMRLLEFVDQLYHLEGYRIFFIDEIHKYKNWNQEIKNLYDAFPDIKIVFSGSSQLELTQGSYDLSRRVSVYHLPGLSFREYLHFTQQSYFDPISLDELLLHPKKLHSLATVTKIAGHFKKYLRCGYYPFVVEVEQTHDERVLRIIDKIIFEDIPNYFDLKTNHLYLFKKILGFLASISPGDINIHTIAQNMQIAHQTLAHYLSILSQVGLIQMVYPFEGGNQYLRKPQKIFLHNTSLLQACQKLVGEPVTVGTVRELYFLQALRDAQHEVFYAKPGDFRTQKHIFEIGGKNKKGKQIAEIKTPAFLVKDDILLSSHHAIPLMYFGFLY